MWKKFWLGFSLILAFSITTGINASQTEAASYHSKAISIAKSTLGVKYRWGGNSPQTGFDCSGLVRYSFSETGKYLPRTAAAMYKQGKKVTFSNLELGDLMFFAPNKASRPTHVAIYIGNNQFIHSSTSRGVSLAQTNNTYWKPKFIGAKRI